jgi:hypothetical protein
MGRSKTVPPIFVVGKPLSLSLFSHGEVNIANTFAFTSTAIQRKEAEEITGRFANVSPAVASKKQSTLPTTATRPASEKGRLLSAHHGRRAAAGCVAVASAPGVVL